MTFKEFNSIYAGSARRTMGPPLAVNRVKVTFKDEPGEGSGVARSFYTAIAEVNTNPPYCRIKGRKYYAHLLL